MCPRHLILCGRSISYPFEDVAAEVEPSDKYDSLFAFLCAERNISLQVHDVDDFRFRKSHLGGVYAPTVVLVIRTPPAVRLKFTYLCHICLEANADLPLRALQDIDTRRSGHVDLRYNPEVLVVDFLAISLHQYFGVILDPVFPRAFISVVILLDDRFFCGQNCTE